MLPRTNEISELRVEWPTPSVSSGGFESGD